jgi:hypothetical protein
MEKKHFFFFLQIIIVLHGYINTTVLKCNLLIMRIIGFGYQKYIDYLADGK